MELLKHDIEVEFPQLKGKIDALRSSHPAFARLYDGYGDVNRTIRKVEMGGAAMAEAELEELKKQRIKLKDDLVRLLRAS